MSIMMDVVNKLSVSIGPRPPGSPEEAAAARYLDGFFTERGLESRVMPFRSTRTFSLTFAVFYALGSGSVLIYRLCPWTALLLALANALLFAAEINTFRIFGALFNCWRSHNTIAHLPAAGGRAVRSIVVSAHLDSSRSGILFTPPVVYLFRLIFLGGLASLALIPLLLAAALFTGEPFFWTVSLAPALFLLSGILLLLQRELCGRYTAGANDNASAVAVMAALADRFAQTTLRHCELWFVGTGSEESGIIGMTDFLKRFRGELTNPLFVNLESVGCGKLYYVEREGMFPTRKADPGLVRLARATAAEKGLPISGGRFHAILTDNVAVLARKLPGLTIMGCGPRWLIPHWHQLSDTADQIEPGNLELALDFSGALIEAIDSQLAP